MSHLLHGGTRVLPTMLCLRPVSGCVTPLTRFAPVIFSIFLALALWLLSLYSCPSCLHVSSHNFKLKQLSICWHVEQCELARANCNTVFPHVYTYRRVIGPCSRDAACEDRKCCDDALPLTSSSGLSSKEREKTQSLSASPPKPMLKQLSSASLFKYALHGPASVLRIVTVSRAAVVPLQLSRYMEYLMGDSYQYVPYISPGYVGAHTRCTVQVTCVACSIVMVLQ